MWQQYEPEGNDYIPVEQWGQDHWSTLAYLETCAVDKKGIVDNRKMRCDPRLHRHFASMRAPGFDNRIVDGAEYPTRLADDKEITRHDDWSCLEDMVAAGMVVAEWRIVRPHDAFGNAEVRVTITSRGQQVSAAIRQHKTLSSSYRGFKWIEKAS